MSILYTFDVYLDAWPSEDTILNILKKGEYLGITYHDDVKSPSLTLAEATRKVLSKIENPDEDQDLYVKKNDSIGFFWFYITSEKTVCFSMGGFSNKKERYYGVNVPMIDTAYYLKLAIDLCADFFITKIEVMRS